MNKLSLLIVANLEKNPNSGASGTVIQTTEAFRELGHNVDEVWSKQIGRSFSNGNLHQHFELPLRYWLAVKRAIRAKVYDVIQISQPYAWLAALRLKQMGYSGIVVNRSHGWEGAAIKCLDLAERNWCLDGNNARRRLTKRIWRQLDHWHCMRSIKACDGQIVPSQMDADNMKDMGADPRRICVAHHGVTQSILNSPYVKEKKQGSFARLLYVGQSSFFKAPMVLAEALNELSRKRVNYQMTWVTASQSHAYIKSLLSDSAQAQTQLLPWQSQDKLGGIYDKHDIFVFPSFYEGAGKASLEAMARGMCVVASDVGAMKDYIINNESGLLVEPGNARELSNVLLKLASDEASIHQMGARAKVVAKEYTWRKCASTAIGFYQKLFTDEFRRRELTR